MLNLNSFCPASILLPNVRNAVLRSWKKLSTASVSSLPPPPAAAAPCGTNVLPAAAAVPEAAATSIDPTGE